MTKKFPLIFFSSVKAICDNKYLLFLLARRWAQYHFNKHFFFVLSENDTHFQRNRMGQNFIAYGLVLQKCHV